jgi:hypothetical protein
MDHIKAQSGPSDPMSANPPAVGSSSPASPEAKKVDVLAMSRAEREEHARQCAEKWPTSAYWTPAGIARWLENIEDHPGWFDSGYCDPRCSHNQPVRRATPDAARRATARKTRSKSGLVVFS